MRNLWMLVSKDKYELPLMVCDSVAELARRTGSTQNNIYSAISKGKKRGNRCQYVKVTINEEENDDR